MKIYTTHINPPIRSDAFDWVAIPDDDDVTGEGFIGHGPTEEAAIEHLLWLLHDDEVNG